MIADKLPDDAAKIHGTDRIAPLGASSINMIPPLEANFEIVDFGSDFSCEILSEDVRGHKTSG